MNTPSPLVPQGSLNQQAKKKLTFPVAVFTILSLHILFIGVMLIQGCHPNTVKKTDDTSLSDTNNSMVPAYVPPTNNLYAAPSTNSAFPVAPTNPVTTLGSVPAATETFASPAPVKAEAPVVSEGRDYTVAKGDTLGKIARKQSVSLGALKKANPGLEPTKLKVGQKLKIPGGTSTTAESSTTAAGGTDSGESGAYSVKAGDTLTKIAKAHGTSARKLRAFNNLSTDKLKVGQKLKIPAGGSSRMAAAKPDNSSATNTDATFSSPASSNALSTNGVR